MKTNVRFWHDSRDKRYNPRVEMFAGVFIVREELAHLSELTNISTGGVSVKKPVSWQPDPAGAYNLYFVLDQDRILCIKGTVVHEQDDVLGFAFDSGYELQAEQLLAESRNWR